MYIHSYIASNVHVSSNIGAKLRWYEYVCQTLFVPSEGSIHTVTIMGYLETAKLETYNCNGTHTQSGYLHFDMHYACIAAVMYSTCSTCRSTFYLNHFRLLCISHTWALWSIATYAQSRSSVATNCSRTQSLLLLLLLLLCVCLPCK